MAQYKAPGQADSLVSVADRYGNFIGGEWVPPVSGKYFENITPVTGQPFTEIARSTDADINLALDAAHGAKQSWGRTSVGERSLILNKIADTIEANLEMLAVAETWENGKPIRESLAADLPLAVDHFRYFAGAIRAQEGTLSEIDGDTIAYHFHEPLGVVGQIIPWNFPILMATRKLAPALAAGNCVVIKPAEQTPWSLLKVMELIADLLPPGVVNIVNGFGVEAGKPLASSNRIAKIAFTGETTTGRLIMQYASQNLIPVTLELGGKSPNIFFEDVAAANDDFYDKALEGFTMSPSTRARSAPARLGRWSSSRSTSGLWLTRSSARRPSSRGIRSTPTPCWAPRRPTTSWRRSSPTWRSAGRRARRCSPAASAPTWAGSCRAATTSPRRSSRATTACASSRRRSSARWSR